MKQGCAKMGGGHQGGDGPTGIAKKKLFLEESRGKVPSTT